MPKFPLTLKLNVWRMTIAFILLNAPIAAFAQMNGPSNLPDFRASANATNPAAIAVIEAIVVNGEKRLTAKIEDVELIPVDGVTPAIVEVRTPLHAGDVLKTKTNAQVTIRFLTGEANVEQLVILDHDTEVVIGSVCLRSGWLLAQVGINFSVCIGNTTLGVKKTEFEVSSTPSEPLKVAVYKGEVEVDTNEPPQVKIGAQKQSEKSTMPSPSPTPGSFPAKLVIGEKEQLVVTAGSLGNYVESPIKADQAEDRINYWSAKIITAYEPAKMQKANPNFNAAAERHTKFKEARFKALWQGDASAYASLGQVYNDWGKGQKAKEVLLLAQQKDSNVAATADFQANLGEAYRLTGNYAAAETHLKNAVALSPNYPFAYYSLGKTKTERFEKEKANLASLDEARGYFLLSLQEDSRGAAVNKTAAEAEMNGVIEQRGAIFLSSQPDWISNEKWWCKGEAVDAVTYQGRLDLPELKSFGLDISGDATLFVIGDQFKLKSGSRILTGNIVGKTTGRYTSVSLRFDDPGITRTLKEPIVVSFRQTGDCNSLVFVSGSGKTRGTLTMEATK